MRGLGQLEATVMALAWEADGAVTVRQILEQLQSDRPLAYTTVMTVMDNLHSKGLLSRQRAGRAYAYLPTRSREQYEADLMDEVLASSRDRSATLMHFVERISGDELAELKELLAGLDAELDAGGDR